MAIGTRFITGIKWYKGLLETLNNMTFVYDVNWNPNNSTKATFPVCFFHVKNMHEIMSSEISQKQMLFYNSSTDSTSADAMVSNEPSKDSGLLNVVADNIVIKPKVYKLDVVIPYRNLSLLDQSFVYNTHTAQTMASILIKDNDKTTQANKILGSYATLTQPFLQLIKTLVKSLITQNYASSVEDWIANVTHQPDYNKESLEVMWRMRHIVKMKVWNSWRYKYVGIVDVDITKEGTEDGVYEATLTLQEMPIISMYAQGDNVRNPFVYKNKLLKVTGDNVVNILNKAGGQLGGTE